MARQTKEKESAKNIYIKKKYGGGGGVVYGLGFIGALVYFLSHVTTFWTGVIGILKAIVWPALLVYSLLSFLKLQ
jgi:hypothetical protein